MKTIAVARSRTQDRDIQEKFGSLTENMVAKRIERAPHATSYELMEALQQLYSREDMTMEFAQKVRSHAEHLSVSLCKAFVHLKEIMERHEPLIRRRWATKTRAERQSLLLEVFPTMATLHRTDPGFAYEEINEILMSSSSLADPIVFPYINLEDLCKPQPLLVFLNARAFNLPWTFTNTEDSFSPYASVPSCLGHDCESVRMDFRFTKDPEPGKYGEAVIVEEQVETFDPANKELFHTCSRKGLHVLYIQERIYTFLLSCARAILHDRDKNTPKDVYTSKSQDPCVSSGESEAIQATSHTLFSDTVLLAPNRARSFVDFSRLRAYFNGVYNSAKDHVRALREDPSYMADTIRELASHRPELIKDTKGRVHWRIGRPELTSLVLEYVIRDAYLELGLWKSLFESTDRLCRMTTDGAIEDLHELYHIVGALQGRANHMLGVLMDSILARAHGSPALRHLYTRHDSRHGWSDKCRHQMKVKKNATEDYLASEIIYILEQLESLASQGNPDQKMLFHVLDMLDMVLGNDLQGRTMISSAVARKVAELSIATECIRQIAMWMATPEVRMSAQLHGECDVHIPEDGYPDLETWVFKIKGYAPLVSAVEPSQGCLTYPVQHYPNRNNVEQMRKAEQNLDRF